MKVKLDDVMEAIILNGSDTQYLYHLETGKIVTYNISDFMEDSELKADLEEDFDKYVALPTKYEINDYHIIEKFIWSLPDEEFQNKLEWAIRGKGAFRKFKDIVYSLGLEQSWYDYQLKAYKEIATRWCKDNDLQYDES